MAEGDGYISATFYKVLAGAMTVAAGILTLENLIQGDSPGWEAPLMVGSTIAYIITDAVQKSILSKR